MRLGSRAASKANAFRERTVRWRFSPSWAIMGGGLVVNIPCGHSPVFIVLKDSLTLASLAYSSTQCAMLIVLKP